MQSDTTQELIRYWGSDYDMGRLEGRLNALFQFMTEIDGVGINFIHVESPHEDALPLIMTHGWPGSVIELLEIVGPLTDPTAHGGAPRTRSTWCCRPCPATGSPTAPRARLECRSRRAGLGGADEPPRLHPLRRPGRRHGRRVTDAMGARRPTGCSASTEPARDGAGRPAAGGVRAGTRRDRPARHIQEERLRLLPGEGHRPQTIGYALLDSPVALAAWMLDHDTDSYYKISRAFVDGEPAGNLTRDHIIDNITLYWLTGTGASAARSYWEGGRATALALASGQAPPAVSLPVGFTTFPGEILRSPRSWVEATPTSPTSTRPTGAATSPPGRSRSSSPTRCGPRSGHFGKPQGAVVGLLPASHGPETVELSSRRPLARLRRGERDGSTPSRSTPAGLRGKVVLVQFWTYSCINWMRTASIRACLVERSTGPKGLVVSALHTPEFPFENEVDNVRRPRRTHEGRLSGRGRQRLRDMGTFANRYWPALYLADAQGRIRYHHFGEGSYEETETVIQKLLGRASPTSRSPSRAQGGRSTTRTGRSLGIPGNLHRYARDGKIASPGGFSFR